MIEWQSLLHHGFGFQLESVFKELRRDELAIHLISD